ncbi:hypothetical protein BD410DRAFT_898299 [Rickenella mellea]|uniref:Uncharacterized protein n=1 Tax=Rickenella mellea TaxID=50990 RepID=A0A4Y7Q3Y9_9AGAM|nr:hypothetical protein BD410DRAFT_898299 [Rickenella mellea]
MNSVPNEILSQIFQSCFRNQRTERFGCACPSHSEAPLLLLRICRRWHDCAMATPSLWSQLSIGRGTRRNMLHSVTVAKGWLDRAVRAPLSLDLCYGKRDPEQSTQNAIHAAMANIFTPSRIWKAVFLEVDKPMSNPYVDAIFEAVLAHAPLLESFAFSLTGFANLVPIVPTTKIEIGWTPYLSSISVQIKQPTHSFHLSFSNVHTYGNIRELTLHWPESIEHAIHILGRCPNVEVLHICLRGEVQTPPQTIGLTLERLHTLGVLAMNSGNTDFGDFFHALTTPALVQLSIQNYDLWAHSPPSNWPPLSQLLERSQPPLKSLTLIGPCMIDDDIISCLQHTRELRVLSGEGHLFSSKVMDALTPSVNPPTIPLCPLLTKIGLQGNPADFSAVTAMTYERWKHSKQDPINDEVKFRIHMVEIVEMPSEHCSRFLDCQGMAACVEEGMELRLT